MAAVSSELKVPESRASPRRNVPSRASNLAEEKKRFTNPCLPVSAVKACQNGDLAAARQIYDACHKSVFHLVVRMVGQQDAEDVTQHVFLQAYRSIHQFQGRSRFETWLYRLTVNESRQHLRRNRRWHYKTLDWDPMEESIHGANVEQEDLLEQSLERLDPELRSIFLLREIEGLSYSEICEAMQIPEGTVGSRLNRARRDLKKHLSDLGL